LQHPPPANGLQHLPQSNGAQHLSKSNEYLHPPPSNGFQHPHMSSDVQHLPKSNGLQHRSQPPYCGPLQQHPPPPKWSPPPYRPSSEDAVAGKRRIRTAERLLKKGYIGDYSALSLRNEKEVLSRGGQDLSNSNLKKRTMVDYSGLSMWNESDTEINGHGEPHTQEEPNPEDKVDFLGLRHLQHGQRRCLSQI
jgi:hypothetical protein